MGWFRIIDSDISDEVIEIPDDSDGLLVVKECNITNVTLKGGMTQLVIRAPCTVTNLVNENFGADGIIISSSNVTLINPEGSFPVNLVPYHIRHPDWIQIICINKSGKPVNGVIENITIENPKLYAPDDLEKNHRGVQGIVAFDCEVRNLKIINPQIFTDIDQHGISLVKPVGCLIDGGRIKAIGKSKKAGIIIDDRKGLGSGYGNLIRNTMCQMISVENTEKINVKIIPSEVDNMASSYEFFDPNVEFNGLLTARDTSVYNPKTGRLYRALEVNNPCNIMDFDLGWNGEIKDKSLYTEGMNREDTRANGDRLTMFMNPVKGFRAAAIDLRNKQAKYADCKNIRGIMKRYAPKSAGNPHLESYIWHIASKIGVTDKEVISVRDYSVMQKFLTAIVEFENGRAQPYPDWMLDQGILEAGISPSGEHKDIKTLGKSKTVKRSTQVAGTVVANAGVEVYETTTSVPSEPVIDELVNIYKDNKENVEAIKEYLASNADKLDELKIAATSYSTLDWLQLVMVFITMFLIVDIILDRRLTNALGIK